MPITPRQTLVGQIQTKGNLEGHVAISRIAPNLQNKSIQITENTTQTITPDENYNGLNKVEITTNVAPNLQDKSIEITENTTTNINADSGYDGLGEVEVTTNIPLPSGLINITQNGTTDVANYGTANVNVQPKLQNKSQTITENTTTTIQADEGYDALGMVTITTNVSGAKPVLPNGIKFADSQVTSFGNLLNELDFSLVTDLKQFFQNCNQVTSIDLSNYNGTPQSSIASMFANCSSLVDLNVSTINISQIFIGSTGTSISGVFMGCSSLSDASLNSILKMCTTYTRFSNGKTLKILGLNSAQATTCQSLSNYQDFINAGWSTGY